MGDPNIYEIDTQIQLTGTFMNVALNAVADPSSVTLYILDPSGNETQQTYPGTISRASVGVYNYIFVPSGPGEWKYKWQGVGDVIATSRDTKFFVRASDLIP